MLDSRKPTACSCISSYKYSGIAIATDIIINVNLYVLQIVGTKQGNTMA